MKTLSAQVIGFTAGSPTTYTTQVHLDGETWTVPIRYSTFRDFYLKIDALEPNFNFDFPKKGGLFSSPPPAQRQTQLDAFMKKSVAHFCERQFPQNVLDLLDDLLDISAHVVKCQETVEPDTEDSASEQEEDDGEAKPKSVAAPLAVLASVPEVETEAAEVAVETVAAVTEITAAPVAEVVVDEVAVPAAVAPVDEAKPPVPVVAEVKPVVEAVKPAEESVVEEVKPVEEAVPVEVAAVTVTEVEVAVAPEVVVDTSAVEVAEPIAEPVAAPVAVVEAEPVVELEPVTEPAAVEAAIEVAPSVDVEASVEVAIAAAVEPVAAAFEKIVESVKLTLEETPEAVAMAPLSSSSTSTEPPSPTAAEKKKKAKQLSEMQKRMRNQKRKEKRKKKSNMKVSAGKSHHAADGTEFDSDDDVLVRVQQPQRKH